MEMAPGHVYQMYGREGQSYGGMYRLDPKMNARPAWLHYVEVADVKRAAEQIPTLGGKVITGPMDVPGGSMLVASDPQGAVFALHTKGAGH
jgi:predicted enzyme related to lactoylglutathione lyase